MFFGNGGSAADAQHLATELTIRYKKNRAAIAAIALTTDTSALTAAGNDLGFEQIFARQIEALGRKGDVAIAISTSGKSANIIAALKQAKAMGLVTAAFGGKGGGDMAGLADHLLVVPSAHHRPHPGNAHHAGPNALRRPRNRAGTGRPIRCVPVKSPLLRLIFAFFRYWKSPFLMLKIP